MSQVAAIEAMRGAQDDVEEMVADYDRRRRLFVKGLDELGLTCPEPGGAFYAFPSIRSSGLSSQEFAERLLAEQKVAVVPGTSSVLGRRPRPLLLRHRPPQLEQASSGWGGSWTAASPRSA